MNSQREPAKPRQLGERRAEAGVLEVFGDRPRELGRERIGVGGEAIDRSQVQKQRGHVGELILWPFSHAWLPSGGRFLIRGVSST